MTRLPNIILINCDDLGYGDLGCYGSTVNRTPHLDRIAAEGTRFTSFYMASPICSPSRGAMLTGCLPPRIGFDDFEGRGVLFPGQGVGLSAQEQTFATLLKRRGYATQIIGKWHCGDQPEFLPTRHGFDHYFGIPYSNDMGRQIGRHQWPPLPLLDDEDVLEAQFDMAAVTERYVQRACRFIRDHHDRPFLLYFAHMYVHLPLIVPQSYLDKSLNGRYGAAVEVIDWATGVLMRTLHDLGLDDNTLILFTSDNGSRARDEGGSNGPLRGTKGQTWDGGMRLPLLARWTGHVPAGRTCDTLMSSIDLLPTFAHLTGAPLPDRPIDGVNQAGVLLGDEQARPRAHMPYFMRSDLEAVRNQRFKLFVSRGSKEGRQAVRELYDLQNDIGETTDVAAQHPQVVRELEQLAEHYHATLGPGGSERRPVGQVENPRPLTEFDPTYPYFAAEYDLPHAG